MVTLTINKINNLTSKVSVLENVIIMINDRLGQLEVSNNSESCGDEITPHTKRDKKV